MGNFYTNYTLHGVRQQAVADAELEGGWRCSVTEGRDEQSGGTPPVIHKRGRRRAGHFYVGP